VGADGSQIGVVDTREAIRQARELDLDLVEVAPQANPPVCRIMDYGKFKYERDIRQKDARKKQSRSGLKEIKFRPKIDPHDYATKKGHVERFLKGGNKVKVTIMFRGREMAHTELGRKILDRLVGDLGEKVVVESMPKQEGRNMIMVVSPSKKFMEQLAKDRERGDAEPEAPEPEAPEPETAVPAEPETVATTAPETAPAEPDQVAATEVVVEPVEVSAAENEG
jgi:translation initiation factor IF-3